MSIYKDTIMLATFNSVYKYYEGNVEMKVLNRNIIGVEPYKEGFLLIEDDSAFYYKSGEIFEITDIPTIDILKSNISISRDSTMYIFAEDTFSYYKTYSQPVYSYIANDTVYYLDSEGVFYKFVYGDYSSLVSILHSNYPIYSFYSSEGFLFGASGYHGMIKISDISMMTIEQKFYRSFVKEAFKNKNSSFVIRSGDWIIRTDSIGVTDSLKTGEVRNYFFNDTILLIVSQNDIIDYSASPKLFSSGAESYSDYKDIAFKDSTGLLLLKGGALIEINDGYTYSQNKNNDFGGADKPKIKGFKIYDLSGRLIYSGSKKTDLKSLNNGVYLKLSEEGNGKILIIK